VLERYLADFLAFFFPQAHAEIDWQRGYTFLDKELQQVVLDLYRFIDWLLELPEELEAQVWQQILQYEEAQHVTYISTAERMGHQKGLQEGREQGLQQGLRQGLLDGLELALELRFGRAGLDLVPELRQIEDPAVLQAVGERLRTANTLDELRRVYLTAEAE
jgi:hypothetical protein